MSFFSEKLKMYIEESNQTIYQLAKKGEINRTVIHKTITGERMPNEAFLEKLYNVLMLAPEEKKELHQLEERERVGEKVYQRRKVVKKVIENLDNNPLFNPAYDFKKSTFAKMPETSEDFQIIQGKGEIEKYLLKLLGDTFINSETPKITLLVPFQQKYLYELLYNFYMSSDKELHILNLIALEKNQKDDQGCLRNLETLSSVLVFSLAEKRGYVPYYYHTNVSNHHEVGVAMPYFIKTEKQIITFPTDFETAFVYNHPESYAHFTRKIEEMFKDTRILAEKNQDCNGMFGWISNEFYEEIIEPAPCLGEFLSNERINAFLKKDIPMREEIYQFGCQFYTNLRENKGIPCSVFSFKGLECFMELGRILNLPKSMIRMLTLEERKELLVEIIEHSKNEKVPYVAVNTNKFKMPMDVEVMKVGGEKIVFQRYNKKGDELTTIFLHEPDLIEAFVDFINYLKTSDMVYEQEEMINRMKELLDREW